jgi:hypothetical protein
MYILLRFETLMMPRALLWCITIVAAFPLHASAAPPPITPVPVTAAVAALAERLGMDVSRDRGRFTSEIIRRIYSPPQSRRVPLDLAVAPRSVAGGTALVTVDVPLSAEIWSSASSAGPSRPNSCSRRSSRPAGFAAVPRTWRRR